MEAPVDNGWFKRYQELVMERLRAIEEVQKETNERLEEIKEQGLKKRVGSLEALAHPTPCPAGTAVTERVRGLEKWLVAPLITIALALATYIVGKLFDWI
jgi:hypothetical protein